MLNIAVFCFAIVRRHRWRLGRNARGANADKVPTVNEARKF